MDLDRALGLITRWGMQFAGEGGCSKCICQHCANGYGRSFTSDIPGNDCVHCDVPPPKTEYRVNKLWKCPEGKHIIACPYYKLAKRIL